MTAFESLLHKILVVNKDFNLVAEKDNSALTPSGP